MTRRPDEVLLFRIERTGRRVTVKSYLYKRDELTAMANTWHADMAPEDERPISELLDLRETVVRRVALFVQQAVLPMKL